MMPMIGISAGAFELDALLESADAPATCAWFERHLSFTSKVVHARWSGEAVWVPLGDLKSGCLPRDEWGNWETDAPIKTAMDLDTELVLRG